MIIEEVFSFFGGIIISWIFCSWYYKQVIKQIKESAK